jgi:hypothetical protein
MFGKTSDVIAIDHVFDLQHNTGNIFYKHPKYSIYSNQVNWALDKKRNEINLYKLIDECSLSIK